jgi:hypothetical protein
MLLSGATAWPFAARAQQSERQRRPVAVLVCNNNAALALPAKAG